MYFHQFFPFYLFLSFSLSLGSVYLYFFFGCCYCCCYFLARFASRSLSFCCFRVAYFHTSFRKSSECVLWIRIYVQRMCGARITLGAETYPLRLPAMGMGKFQPQIEQKIKMFVRMFCVCKSTICVKSNSRSGKGRKKTAEIQRELKKMKSGAAEKSGSRRRRRRKK